MYHGMAVMQVMQVHSYRSSEPFEKKLSEAIQHLELNYCEVQSIQYTSHLLANTIEVYSSALIIAKRKETSE
jgi:hypothetical protein